MRLLLDTHTLLWAVGPSENLSARAAKAIASEHSRVFVSAASLWELAIKFHLGKLRLPSAPNDWVPEVLEETGWQAGLLTYLFGYHPTNGISDQRFELFTAAGASYVGEPSDPSEADRVEWVPVHEVRRLVRDGQIGDGLSLTTLLWWLQYEAS